MISKSPSPQPRYSPYRKKLIDIAKMANYQPIASIPNPSSDFNYTFGQNGSIKKKLVEHESTHVPSSPIERVKLVPAFKLPKLQKYRLQHNPTKTSDHQRYPTIDTRLDTEQISNNLQLNFSRASPKQDLSRLKLRKLNRYSDKRQMSNEQQSETDQEFSTNATPGPGYYSYSSSSFQNSKFMSGSFGSKAERFTEKQLTPKAQIKPENKKQRKTKSLYKKKIIPFLSGCLKAVQEKNESPGPQQYRPRNGIEQELIKKIQRNFKGNFGICSKRFEETKDIGLSPGEYDIYTNDQESKGCYYFTSKKERF